MKKTKLKDPRNETEEKIENSEILLQQEAPKSQYSHSESESESQLQAHSTIDQQQQSLQQNNNNNNNNKRKSMEQQGLSSETDRTRQRYSGIATVV